MDLKQLENLSLEQQQLVLLILLEYSNTGLSESYDELLYADYDEVPVDIHTFIHDRKYLGNALYDPEGRFTLFPYWEKKLEEIFPTNTTTAFNTIILTGSIGIGKAQPLTSIVLTGDGFKKMGELTLSDKVYGVDGKLHNIIGIFPLGKKKICKVTFNDGTSTLCCDEHLWTVLNIETKNWKTVDTKWLINHSENLHRMKSKLYTSHRYKIPLTNPVLFEHKDVFIDPYILGVLIGDGTIGGKTILFTSNDDEVVLFVSEGLTEGYKINKLSSSKYLYSIVKTKNTCIIDTVVKNPVPTPNLYSLELLRYKLNTTSLHKFIPKDYLYNDVNSRIALLLGLLDTDGHITKNGSVIQYYTISEKLKDDVVWLVQSLGGVCRVSEKQSFYTDKNGKKSPGKLCYIVGIKLPKSIIPFRLSRKVERINKKSLEPSRYIDSVEYFGEDECQCIYIDSKEHLYMTNDFIVTHNTLVAVVCMLYMLYRLLCLKDPYLFYGLQPIDKITISFMNISLENARGVAMDKMNQMLLSSEWFMEHGEMSGVTNLDYRPNKHIELVAASSNNQIVGRALFCLDGETYIKTDSGDFKLKDLVDKEIKVISLDDNGNELVSDVCTVVPTIVSNEEYQIELEDGTLIKCTPNHKFLLKDGTYKEALYLTECDELEDTI